MMDSQIYHQLSRCTVKDAAYVRRMLAKYKKSGDSISDSYKTELQVLIEASCERVEKRKSLIPLLRYPAELPVSQKADEISKLIESNQVVIVAGETGSGKTTQLPKICLSIGCGTRGMIGHTQPRRLAARAVSSRLAEELNTTLGDKVGFQIRFNEVVSDNTLVKLMTDGILLAEIQNDPYLNRYDTIIIDEAHERSLNIDFLLGYLKQLILRRKDLKIIITSATIDVDRFSEHFNNAPIIEVTGRSFPVDVRYRPMTEVDDQDDYSLNDAVASVLGEIIDEERIEKRPPGDVLVFLPGEREIRELSKHLKHCELRDTEYLPLYARLGNSDQQRIFKAHSGRRVVLSTNVAETSLTVPGIRYVIDTGTARISRYSYRSKIQRLPIEPVSQASANQRKGRCGRVAEGICYRLYSEEDFHSRPQFTDPEIIRTNLAAVILRMAAMRLGDVSKFPFINKPENKLINDGYKALFELGAIDEKRRLTSLGKTLSKFPVDPRVARMLVEAGSRGCLQEVLVITSALSIQDPRERPAEKSQAADQAHALFKDKDSDLLSYLNLWKQYEENRQSLSASQLKKFCQKHFLSFMRMREWREVHRQLHLLTKELGISENKEAASYEAIHRSVLVGLLNNIGEKQEKREYRGARNRVFQIVPGSSCYKKTPKWLMSAEIVETTQVYARDNAYIEPQWIENAASHLIKKQWFEPHWEKKSAQVVAFEKVSLYGLDLVRKRRVNYGPIDPVVSREIFIRNGLVEGELTSKAPFYKKNLELVAQVDDMESKTRRRDILADEEDMVQFYLNVIPAHVVGGTSFDKWWRRASENELKKCEFTLEELIGKTLAPEELTVFPNTINLNELDLPLSYAFRPGEINDGVTLKVPAGAIKQLPLNRLEWLVPGLLREKCIQLVKNLPRAIRKKLVPVPDYVDKALLKMQPSDLPLTVVLSEQLKMLSGVVIKPEDWNVGGIEEHLRINIEVLDDAGKEIKQSRDILELMEEFKDVEFKMPEDAQNGEGVVEGTSWVFDTLPETVTVTQGIASLNLIPALEDQGHSVKKVVTNDAAIARQKTIRGVGRLLLLNAREQVEYTSANLPGFKEASLMYAPYGKAADLRDDVLMASAQQLIDENLLPRNRHDFEHLLTIMKAEFYDTACRYSLLVKEILRAYLGVQKRLKGKISLDIAASSADLKFQIENLVFRGFISKTPFRYLQHVPRYLEAANIRAEKMSRNMAVERTSLPVLKECWQQYEARQKQLDSQGIYDPELERYRWMIEEYRVSLFAQQLGTEYTVSDKRLAKQWQNIKL